VIVFFAVELKLSIELDGGDHEDKAQKFSDNNKDLDLMSLGWTVLRYTNEEVFSFIEMVLNDIRGYIQRLREIKSLIKKKLNTFLEFNIPGVFEGTSNAIASLLRNAGDKKAQPDEGIMANTKQ